MFNFSTFKRDNEQSKRSSQDPDQEEEPSAKRIRVEPAEEGDQEDDVVDVMDVETPVFTDAEADPLSNLLNIINGVTPMSFTSEDRENVLVALSQMTDAFRTQMRRTGNALPTHSQKRINLRMSKMVSTLSSGKVDIPSLRDAFGYTADAKGTIYTRLAIRSVIENVVGDKYGMPALKDIASESTIRSLKKFSIDYAPEPYYEFIRMVAQVVGTLGKRFENIKSINSQVVQDQYHLCYTTWFGPKSTLSDFVIADAGSEATSGQFLVPALETKEDVYTVDEKPITVKSYSASFGKPVVKDTAYYRPTMNAPYHMFATILQQISINMVEVHEFNKFQQKNYDIARTHYFGTGDIVNLGKRLTDCYSIYKNCIKTRKTVGVDFDIEDRYRVGETLRERTFWYFSALLGYGVEGAKNNKEYSLSYDGAFSVFHRKLDPLEDRPSQWFAKLSTELMVDIAGLSPAQLPTILRVDEETINAAYLFVPDNTYNPINYGSEAGSPYAYYKKGACLFDILFNADNLYNKLKEGVASSKLIEINQCLTHVHIKPKAEVFKLREPIPDIIGLDAYMARLHCDEALKKNESQLKGRGIYVPCPWTSVPLGMIMSMTGASFVNPLNHLRELFETTGDLPEFLVNNIMVPLKEFSFVSGNFDFLFKRIQGLHPFDTESLLKDNMLFISNYSDNKYAAGLLDEDLLLSDYPDLNISSPDELSELTNMYRSMGFIPAGTRVLASLDGSKMEACTTDEEAKVIMRAYCEFFKIPPFVTKFICELAIYGVAGGKSIIGSKMLNQCWQNSGSQCTFLLNDLKTAQASQLYVNSKPAGLARRVNIKQLIEASAVFGITMNLEQIVILPDIGTPLTRVAGEVKCDFLGYSAVAVNSDDIAFTGVTIYPCLAEDRRYKSRLYRKSQTPITAKNSFIDIPMKSISLLLTGSINFSWEAKVDFGLIDRYASDLLSMLSSEKSDDIRAVCAEFDGDGDTIFTNEFKDDLMLFLTSVIDDSRTLDSKYPSYFEFFSMKYQKLYAYETTSIRNTNYLTFDIPTTLSGTTQDIDYGKIEAAKFSRLSVDPKFKVPVNDRDKTIYAAIYESSMKEKWPVRIMLDRNQDITGFDFNYGKTAYVDERLASINASIIGMGTNNSKSSLRAMLSKVLHRSPAFVEEFPQVLEQVNRTRLDRQREFKQLSDRRREEYWKSNKPNKKAKVAEYRGRPELPQQVVHERKLSDWLVSDQPLWPVPGSSITLFNAPFKTAFKPSAFLSKIIYPVIQVLYTDLNSKSEFNEFKTSLLSEMRPDGVVVKPLASIWSHMAMYLGHRPYQAGDTPPPTLDGLPEGEVMRHCLALPHGFSIYKGKLRPNMVQLLLKGVSTIDKALGKLIKEVAKFDSTRHITVMEILSVLPSDLIYKGSIQQDNVDDLERLVSPEPLFNHIFLPNGSDKQLYETRKVKNQFTKALADALCVLLGRQLKSSVMLGFETQDEDFSSFVNQSEQGVPPAVAWAKLFHLYMFS